MRKTRARKWVICQWCRRNIYTGERCWKIQGLNYWVCWDCGEKEIADREEVRRNEEGRVS